MLDMPHFVGFCGFEFAMRDSQFRLVSSQIVALWHDSDYMFHTHSVCRRIYIAFQVYVADSLQHNYLKAHISDSYVRMADILWIRCLLGPMSPQYDA